MLAISINSCFYNCIFNELLCYIRIKIYILEKESCMLTYYPMKKKTLLAQCTAANALCNTLSQ